MCCWWATIPEFEDLAAQLIGASAFGLVAGLRMPTAGAAHIGVWRRTLARRADKTADTSCG